MKLEQLIRGIAIEDRRGYFETDIRAIASDSRRVREGDLFVAVRGTSSDGHDYIDQALERGALAVLAESWPEKIDRNLTVRPNVILVENARRALALAAANLHANPSRDLVVAGVTGTNGKTTVTHILEAIADAAGKRTGLIGTVGARFADREVPATHTTPDALELQALLARMKREAITHVVMEVSSHALDQQRVTGVHFKVAGFTNFSQDHLDYHESLEAYFEAKASFFTRVLSESEARGRMAVINIDDPKGSELVERWGGKTLTTSLDGNESADLHVVSAEYGLQGTTAQIRTRKGEWQIATHLVGPHNLANVLTAVGMAQAMGFSKARIDAGLAALTGVPGRFEPVPNDEGKRVFVDYAHTPGALEHVIRTARPLTSGRIIVVFGCGGDRDRAKRAVMGRVVAEGADTAVLTSDNPRSEDPRVIAEAVESGLREVGWTPGEAGELGTYAVELDRRAAIRRAIGWMRADDVVIIAGKGHERVQIVKAESLPFDDREEARRIISGLPPPPPPPGTTEGPTTELIESSAVVESIDIEPDIVEETEEAPPSEDSK